MAAIRWGRPHSSLFGALMALTALVVASGALAAEMRPRPAAKACAPSDAPGPRVLVYSRTTGFRHDSIPDAIQALRELGAANGFQVDATEDPTAFTDDTLAHYAAVVFLMTTGDVLDESQQAAFERYIRAGNGYVGVHSATDTEYDWPWYGGLVSAYFSRHPAIQTASVHIADAEHPSTVGLPDPWIRTDEWYDFRHNPRGSGTLQVLATLDESSYQGGGMGADHPIAWYQVFDGGRAWYTAGGHTSESYTDPLFRQHLLGGILYAANLSAPSPGAAVLFDGTTLDQWRGRDRGPAPWSVVDGALQVAPGSGDIQTAATFNNFRLHLEFRVPSSPDDSAEQERGNSGVYLQGRYELQVLDSFGRDLSDQNDAGALYGVKDADLNAALRAGAWQSYDVTFQSARWAPDGATKEADARVSVRWNGIPVQRNMTLPGSTPGGDPESVDGGPIRLQDHGQPVQYRNVWIEPLS